MRLKVRIPNVEPELYRMPLRGVSWQSLQAETSSFIE